MIPPGNEDSSPGESREPRVWPLTACLPPRRNKTVPDTPAAARVGPGGDKRLTRGASWFADEAAWKAYLPGIEETSKRHVRIATEGALPGSLIAHGVSPEMGVLSDGAGQFDVFVHALCWLHVERPLERLVPHNEKHRHAIERILSEGQIRDYAKKRKISLQHAE